MLKRVYLEECLVEEFLVILPVLPEDNLAEIREVDQPIVAHLVSHIYCLLFSRVQTQGLHGLQDILEREMMMVKTVIYSQLLTLVKMVPSLSPVSNWWNTMVTASLSSSVSSSTAVSFLPTFFFTILVLHSYYHLSLTFSHS